MKTKKTAEKITAQNSLNNQSNVSSNATKRVYSVITKDEWQRGDFRYREDCKTQKGYYKAVERFVEKYGEETKEDLLLCRSGSPTEWADGYGCSFTTNVNICRQNAKRAGAKRIYWLFIPKGTRVVYLPSRNTEKVQFIPWEEEFVIPIHKLNLTSDNFGVFARFEGEFNWISDFETLMDLNRWIINPSKKFDKYMSLSKNFFADKNFWEIVNFYKAA